MYYFICLNILTDHISIFELFCLRNKTTIVSHGVHRVLDFLFISNIEVCGNISQLTLLPLPLKLRESEIWDSEVYFSLIIMYYYVHL